MNNDWVQDLKTHWMDFTVSTYENIHKKCSGYSYHLQLSLDKGRIWKSVLLLQHLQAQMKARLHFSPLELYKLEYKVGEDPSTKGENYRQKKGEAQNQENPGNDSKELDGLFLQLILCNHIIKVVVTLYEDRRWSYLTSVWAHFKTQGRIQC